MKKISFILAVCLIYNIQATYAQTNVNPLAGRYYKIEQLPTGNNVVLGAHEADGRPVVQTPSDTVVQAFRFVPVYGKTGTYHIINGAGNYLSKSTDNAWNTLYGYAANAENSQWVIKNEASSATSFRLMLVINSGYLASDNVSSGSNLYCNKANNNANGLFVLQPVGLGSGQWQKILDRTILEAVADTTAIHSATGSQGYNNLAQYRSALANAGSLSDNALATLENAAVLLNNAIDEYDAIVAAYATLKTAIDDFTAKLSVSGHPSGSPVRMEAETALADAQAAYDSPFDQRALIASIIANLTAKAVTLETHVIPSAGQYYRIQQLPANNNVFLGASDTQPVVQNPSDAVLEAFRFAPVHGKAVTYHIINGAGNYLNKSTSNNWSTLFESTANAGNSQWVIKNDASDATSFRLMLVINSGYLASDNTDSGSQLYCDKASDNANGLFTLQPAGLNSGQWQQILDRTILEAVADTTAIHSATGSQGYNNLAQYRSALANAGNLPDDNPATLEAATVLLNNAIDEYDAIAAAYVPLKTAITDFAAKLNASEYPAKTDLETALANAQAAYDSPSDQRMLIASIIANLTTKAVTLNTYARLKDEIAKAKQTYNTTDYPDKTTFGSAITVAEGIYAVPADQNIPAAINSLNTAFNNYVKGRPSNRATIRNGILWKDDRGESVQAHGAGFLQVGDTWYMIGEDRSYSNAGVNMYSTKDFVQWKFEGKVIPPSSYSSERFIERPKLLYCAATGKYVIWCHYEGKNYGPSEAASFVCDSVNGLYKLVFGGRPLGIKSRDCNVFVDNDGTAYFISTTNDNKDLGLFKLSDDYLTPVSHTKIFAGNGREAPAIVRIGNTYFMLSSACTGWDPNQCKISYSNSLTSGWSNLANLGNKISSDTQAASILTVQGREGTSYIYVGDRWQDPALAESKTIMFPISFSGNSCTFNYKESFDLDLPLGKTYDTDNSSRYVSKNSWSIHSYSSQETSSENSPASNVIDGNVSTKWHTKYSSPAASAPHHIAVNMGAKHTISGFLCVPRTDNDTGGLIRQFIFETSNDGSNWTIVSGGSWLPYYSEVYFESPVEAQYFRLTSLSGDFASIAEFYILQNTESYTPQLITPYYKTGAASNWQEANNIAVDEGSTLIFGPNNSGRGSWVITGPNNLIAAAREYTIASVQVADQGAYTYFHLNQYNQMEKCVYNVTVGIHEVIYDGNTHTGGNVPVDGTLYYDNCNVVISGNTGVLEKADACFIGWSGEQKPVITAPTDIPVDLKQGGDNFAITSDTTFYAVWVEDKNGPEGIPDSVPDYLQYEVIYNGNTHTGGSVPVDNKLYDNNCNVVISGNTGVPAKTDACFIGWSGTQKTVIITPADIPVDLKQGGDNFTITSDTTFYAVWAEDKNGPDGIPDNIPDYLQVKVTYRENSSFVSTGGSLPVPNPTMSTMNTSVTVKGNTGGLSKNYSDRIVYAGWTKTDSWAIVEFAAQKPSDMMNAGNVLPVATSNIDLYVVWAYDRNGNSIPDFNEPDVTVTPEHVWPQQDPVDPENPGVYPTKPEWKPEYEVPGKDSWIAGCDFCFTITVDPDPYRDRTFNIHYLGALKKEFVVDRNTGNPLEDSYVLPRGQATYTIYFSLTDIPDEQAGQTGALEAEIAGGGSHVSSQVQLYNRPSYDRILVRPVVNQNGNINLGITGGSPYLMRSINGHNWRYVNEPLSDMEQLSVIDGVSIWLREPNGCWEMQFFFETYVNPEVRHYVDLPYSQDVITNPGSGKHYVEGHKNFTFTASFPGGIPLKITAQGFYSGTYLELVGEDLEDGSYKYVIPRVVEPWTVSFGSEPSGTKEPYVKGLSVWSYRNTLNIRSDTNTKASIYMLNGSLYKQLDIKEGDNKEILNRGVYLIITDNNRYKVIIY
jgi:hypothetical protein